MLMVDPPAQHDAALAQSQPPGGGAGMAAEPLSRRTARGFLWAALQTFGTRAVAIVGQVVLAWLLRPDDFGLVSIAYSVSALAGIIQMGGLRDVLTRRHRRIDRWSQPAFWLAMALGLAAAGLLACAAPAVAAIYDRPEVTGLIWVLAVVLPLNAASTVPLARLQVELRMAPLAILGFAEAIVMAGSSITLAMMGFGPYSFVLPQVLVAACRVPIVWRLARWIPQARLHVRRWRPIARDNLLTMLTQLILLGIDHGDYIVLGLLAAESELGVYYFAFNLSMQLVALVASNLGVVLFPSLARLTHDRQRQTQAFLRASRALMLIGVPLCLLQAAMADSIVRLLFPERWEGAIVPLAILSIGMAVRITSWPVSSLLRAQGRFGLRLALSTGGVGAFLILVIVGAQTFGAIGVAAAAAIYFAVGEPIQMAIALHVNQYCTIGRELVRIYLLPFATATLAVGIGWLASRLVNASGDTSHLARLLIAGVVGMASYGFMAYLVCHSTFTELRQHLLSLAPSRLPAGVKAHR